MSNPYIIQSIGLAITVVGILALIALTTFYGKPLSDEERRRLGEKRGGLYRLPINIETIISTLIFLGGIGILSWSKFELCTYIAYWLPNLHNTLTSMLRCN